MKLIKPYFEIIEQQPSLEGLYKQIELCGRVAYKSEDKITEDSYKGFVDKIIKLNHCYTGDTEVLTENGWIKFKNYNGEKVAAINKDCSFKGFETPSRIINHSYKGNFYYYPSLGLEVTDGHNMFGIFRESKNNFYKNNSYSLFKCNEYYKDNNGREKTLGERMFKTPRHCIKNKFLNPYGELIGFWLGDGCYSPKNKNKLIFHLKKPRKIEYLKQLCEELGYVFEKRKSDYYTVTNDNIGSSFNSLFYNNGKRISLQYFPSIDIAYSIINGLINSDGSQGLNTKTISFSNTSKSIIDWLLMYAPICGYSISNKSISHYTTVNNPVYRVFLLDTDYTLNNDSRNKDSKVIITDKVEEVYCVTVSTGLIMVRGTNGITTICGNCAVLEHGTVYLKVEPTGDGSNYSDYSNLRKYLENPYSKMYLSSRTISGHYKHYVVYNCYVTTNLRVLVENNWLDDLKYLCEPTEHHEKRVCVRFVCDRGVSHEFVRHRTFSFLMESTRYCNYSKDKFSKECTFIIPSWLDIPEGDAYFHDGINFRVGANEKNLFGESVNSQSWTRNNDWKEVNSFLRALEVAEYQYLYLLMHMKWTPQQARAVLPNALKTELIMTGFISDWKHFFELRCPASAHPQARELAIPLKEEFIKRGLL